MAPIEPEARDRSNAIPLALFSGQIVLVALLTSHALFTVYRAARTLPPPTSTRNQQPVRRRHVAIFSVLGLLSLASVTTFSVLWRFASYLDWAEKGNHETPGSLWTGSYGTGDEGVGKWRLGDWASDIDLLRELDGRAVTTPEGFLYASQHFAGLAVAAIFYGVEGHRRNLSTTVITSFVLLSATGSLGYALSLFFILILYTPLTQHSGDVPRRDVLFTPKAAVYLIPVVLSSAALHWFPNILVKGGDVTLFRAGYLLFPLFLAFAPRVIPVSWGHQHVSKAAAHRSFCSTFWTLGLLSLLQYLLQLGTSVAVNTPPKNLYVYDLLRNAIGKDDETNRFYKGLANTAQNLKFVSTDPAISVTASDVLFTAISLVTWAFARNLDVNDLMDNSALSWLSSSTKSDKHVAFEDEVDGVEDEPEVPVLTSPRKRGRPRKNESVTNAVAPAPASSVGSRRRSTRQKTKSDYESDAESSYKPTKEAAREVTQTEADGVPTSEDVVQGGETTAIALFLAIAGGLGPLAASILGAEVVSGAPAH
ncbi:hypothetical protein EJ04DRAFT_464414 [Polyplosphaeria fusca]|uniref:Uncharacterized protein n=1 Tax=Polyplosphaeria fusca TaxID=682080 RepID=A0A9P4V4T1_9PLEO|nr:hypothetical protein EJ04DRAFT_464414 [Polyplosphaeria fusca]